MNQYRVPNDPELARFDIPNDKHDDTVTPSRLGKITYQIRCPVSYQDVRDDETMLASVKETLRPWAEMFEKMGKDDCEVVLNEVVEASEGWPESKARKYPAPVAFWDGVMQGLMHDHRAVPHADAQTAGKVDVSQKGW